MKKNILIIGPSRVGKTSLAKLLNKNQGYSIISIDDIVSGLEAYPELHIHHDGDALDTAKRLAPFLKNYLIELSEGNKFYDGVKYVIEGTHIDFEMIIPFLKNDKYRKKYEIIGLTFNDITDEELYKNIKKYDTEDDWTYWCDVEELKRNASYFIKKNLYFKEKFKEYNIKTFDTSENREKELKKALKYIEDINYGKKNTD